MKIRANYYSALFKKELLLLFRSSESFLSMIFFSLLVLLIFDFGFPVDKMEIVPMVCPFIWLTTLFGGMLRLNRTYEAENEQDILETMRLIKGVAIPFFVSKTILNFIFILCLEFVVFFFTVILFDVPHQIDYIRIAWLPLFLGALGFSCVGTTFSGMVLSHGRRDLILPVILYPILVPLIIGVIKSLSYSAGGELLGLDMNWIRILISFNVVYIIASIMVFDYLIEA